MIKAKPKDAETTAIADWELTQPDDANYITLVIKDILTVKSEYNLEECKKLVRAIINSYLNLEQQRNNIDQNRSRERKLLINYNKKEDWKWRLELSEIARLYQMYEGREMHKALIEIQGRVFKFESQISHRFNPFDLGD